MVKINLSYLLRGDFKPPRTYGINQVAANLLRSYTKMNFCEAMNLLKNGSKVTRRIWKGSMYFMMNDEKVMSYQPRFLDYSYDETIMISDQWMIDRDIMKNKYAFCEIIPFLNEGQRAHRIDWKDMFIFLDKNAGRLILHVMDRLPFVPQFESFTATDWIEDDPI